MEAEFEEHPSVDDLQAFAEGRLDDGKTEKIGVHVEQCSSCAEHVNGLDVDAETVVFESLSPAATQRMTAEPFVNEDSPEGIAVDDRLELQEVIGSGGMGVVYRAWQPNINRHVAVKQLHVPLPHQDPGSLKSTTRFQREVRALGSVLHPHLARIYSSGITSEGRLFYSMELIDGANLSVIFRELMKPSEQSRQQCAWHVAVTAACAKDMGATDSDDSAISDAEHDYIRTVVEIVRQIATAVQALHAAGIVHRDIKPGNIMVNAGGNHATLMDLGLAGLIDDQEARLTRTGLIAGSLPYVSPEQFRGEPPSQSGDIYNLGAVLWELLTRQRLFQGRTDATDAEMVHRILHEDAESVRRHSAEVSVDLEAVVLKCLEKQPADRYSDLSELIADIDRHFAGQAVLAVRRDFKFGVRSFVKRYRKRILAGAVLLAVQAALIFAIFQTASTSTPPEQLLTDGQTKPATIATTKTAAAPVINDGSLVAYWSGEGTDSTARDNSPNENNGALIGDASRANGAVGKAYSFDGDGDYINFGRSSKWNFLHDGSAFSVTGYVAPTSSNLDGGILTTIDETSTAANRHGLSVRLDGSRRLEARIQGVGGKFPTGAKSQTVLKPDVPTAFAVTFDGQTTQLFINGQLEATEKVVAPFASSTALDALSMGSIGTTSGPNGQPFSPFEGLIDEVQIYNRALTKSDVAFLAGQATHPPAVMITVVASAFFAEGGAMPSTDINATHNGRGLGAPFPNFPGTHSANPADGILTAASYAASLHYDFGKEQSVNEIRLWNFHGGTYGLQGNGRGAKSIRVYASNDPDAFNEMWHDSWELVTAFTATRAPPDGALTSYGEEHRFDECNARFLRLQLDNNYGANNVGLAEVQFLKVNQTP